MDWMFPAKWKRRIKQSVYEEKTMIVVHTSCFDESTELQEILKIFEQKQDLTHLHLQHLKDDEDWDEALDLIIKADRIISI